MIKYYKYLFILLVGIFISCDKDKEEIIEEPIDYGQVEADFFAKTIDGQVVTEIEMGEKVTFFDISKGRPDLREWTFPGSKNESFSASNKLSATVSYRYPGKYSVKMKVKRSSDGEEDEVEKTDYLTILSTPVTANFGTNYIEEEGKITIKLGDVVSFRDISGGLPDSWSWTFDGGTPTTSDQKEVDVQYRALGSFNVLLTANRDDLTSIETGDIRKEGYVEVVPRVMDATLAVFDGNSIEVTFTDALMNDLAEVNTNDFMVTAETTAGTITPKVTGVAAVDGSNNKIVLSLDQGLYDDDFVSLTFVNSGSFVDATELTPVANFTIGCHGVYQNQIPQEDQGFENQDRKWWLRAKNNYAYSQDYAYEGEWSLKFYASGGLKNLEARSKWLTLPAGDYYYYMRVYVTEGVGPRINTWIQSPWGGLGGFETGTAETGKWVEFKKKVTIKGSQKALIYKSDVIPTEGVVMYIDDIGFFNTEIRP